MIETLEDQWRNRVTHQAARIEALEAALRKIADLIDSEADDPLDDAIRIAQAALDPASQNSAGHSKDA